MKAKNICLSFLILLLISCSSSIKPDANYSIDSEYCNELKVFVDQRICDEKTVVLETCFMCGDTFFKRFCEHFEYGPGIKFCSYLLKNARTEFPQQNLDKALMCLAGESYKPMKNVWQILNDVEYHFKEVKRLKNDVMVSVYFQKNEDKGYPTLKIQTEGFCDD